jgi:hypothetical protein
MKFILNHSEEVLDLVRYNCIDKSPTLRKAVKKINSVLHAAPFNCMDTKRCCVWKYFVQDCIILPYIVGK